MGEAADRQDLEGVVGVGAQNDAERIRLYHQMSTVLLMAVSVVFWPLLCFEMSTAEAATATTAALEREYDVCDAWGKGAIPAAH